MKYFGLIAVVCLFQSIRLSFACNGYSMNLIKIKNGDHNNHIKFDDNYRFELTDDCRILASSGFTILSPYKKASISIRAKNDKVTFYKLKKTDLCSFLADFSIFDFKCPSEKPESFCIEHKERGNISKYGPYLDFIEGNFTALVRIDYDDVDIPDVYTGIFNVKLKNSTQT